MRLGIVTYNVIKDWSLDDIISKLPALGFEAVELRTTHAHGVEPSLAPAAREAVRQKFAASPLRLLGYGTTCEFHSPDPEVRRQQIELARQFVDLAHDTGALGVKVRPNAFPPGVSREQTISHIAAALATLGDYAAGKGIEIWLEVHGRETQNPPVMAAVMKAARHPAVGLCWNSNPTDLVNGSVKASFELLAPWIRHCHINELAHEAYPWRELFTLLRQARYERYTMCEAQESKEPERFLRWYRALWKEMNRA